MVVRSGRVGGVVVWDSMVGAGESAVGGSGVVQPSTVVLELVDDLLGELALNVLTDGVLVGSDCRVGEGKRKKEEGKE